MRGQHLRGRQALAARGAVVQRAVDSGSDIFVVPTAHRSLRCVQKRTSLSSTAKSAASGWVACRLAVVVAGLPLIYRTPP